MTRGDFEFLWHYRDGAARGNEAWSKNKSTRHLVVRNILSNCGYQEFLPNNTPAGVKGALNSMDPESYEYVQNVHGYSAREPKQESK